MASFNTVAGCFLASALFAMVVGKVSNALVSTHPLEKPAIAAAAAVRRPVTGSVPAELVALAQSLADAARPIAARYFRTSVTVDDKSDLSPVTIADREAETAMRALLAKHMPDHGVFGEEHGAE